MTLSAAPRGAKPRWIDRANRLLPLWNFVSLVLAGVIATLYSGALLGAPSLSFAFWNEQHGIQIFVVGVLGAFFPRVRSIATILDRKPLNHLLRSFTLRYLIFVGLLMTLGFVSRAFDNLPRSWVVVGLVSAFVLMLSVRIALLDRQPVRKIAVVGAGPVADRLIQHLHTQRRQGIEFMGLFDDRRTRSEDAAFAAVGTVADLIELGRQQNIDWVLVTLPCTAENRLLSLLRRLRAVNFSVGLCPQNVGLRVPYGTVRYVGTALPVSLLADRPINRWDAVTKRVEDLVLGGLITLALSPLMLIIVLTIKYNSPGPAVYWQRRHAWNNREFDVCKFRSMYWASPLATNAPLQQTARNDPRITAVGRFLRRSSLDELPQLFNVLKGEMSLIGPRPHAINMRTEERLGQEIIDVYAHRHRVKPGITGWAQVNGFRGATQTVDQLRRRVDFDLQYIDHWSFWLDMKILVLTGWVVIRGTNAY